RVGGRLAQVAAPATLLAEPADDFVREFLGRDRGIRRLSFVSDEGLQLRSDLTIPVTTPVATVTAAAAAAGSEWLAVVDEENRPLGWVTPADLPAGGTLREAPLAPYGSYVWGDALRTALDAA